MCGDRLFCLLGVYVEACFELFFLGGDQSKPYWRSPSDSSQHIPTTMFSKKISPKVYNEQERSDNQNLFGGNNGVQFIMFLSFSVILNEVTFVQILNWFCYNSVVMALALRFQYLLAGSCFRSHIEVARKLSSSGSPQASSKPVFSVSTSLALAAMRELVHVQGGQMSDIGWYACKIDVLSLFLVHDFLFYALVYLLSLTYLKYPQASCGHVVACGCIYTFLSLARPVRKSDWCQVLGSHRRWARHWPNRYLVQQHIF